MPEFKVAKKGLILIYVFLLMVTLTSMVAVFFAGNLNDFKFFADYENEKKAQWLAFGGIARGMAVLKENPSFSGKLPDEPLNGGIISSEILTSPSGKKIISSLGVFKGVKIRVQKEIVSKQEK